MYLGECDRVGSCDPSATGDQWQAFGFDLDGFSSDEDFAGHCKAQPGGKKIDIRSDAPFGVDNSFGRNVLPIFASFQAEPSQLVDAKIDAGEGSLVVVTQGLGTLASYGQLEVSLFSVVGPDDGAGGHVLPPIALVDWPAYTWRPFADTLVTTQPLVAKTHFSTAYATSHVVVSGAPQDFEVTLPFSVGKLPLKLRSAWLTMAFAPDHLSAQATIGGLLETEAFVAVLESYLGQLSTDLCNSTVVDNILTQVRAASDSLISGGQSPAQTCDAISIGFGFDTVRSSFDGTPGGPQPDGEGCEPPVP